MGTNVVLGIGSLWQGGGERVCVNLANELSDRGKNVEIVVSSLEHACYLEMLRAEVKITEIGSRNIVKIFLFYLKFLFIKEKVKFISFNYNISFVVSLVRFFKRFLLVSRSINTLTEEMRSSVGFKGYIKKLLIVSSLNMSDRVVAQSEGMKKDLILNGVNKNIIHVVNNPVSPDFSFENVEKERFIFFAGRLSEQKNLFDLIAAVAMIDSSISLYIAGAGPLREVLAAYVEKHMLSDRVVFLGLVSDIKQYYQKALCTVLTSKYEGFPNVLIESIACGTPVVSYDCPNGPSEIIIDGINGYLIEFGDVNEFANKVMLLSNEPLDTLMISKTADKYSPKYIVEQYLKVLS